jgi:4-amino-4-deoxy-L-arabinose transferase-like glycosyltransferase
MLPTESKFEFTQLWPIILINFILWTIIPSLVFGNLHTDTLEAAYWSRDIAFGYEKHPPLLSWLIKIFEFPGPYGIFPLLSLGQIFSLIATLCIYKSINLLFDKQAAFVGAILSQLSSSATFYALQINHNTALIPIFAAALYFGLKYIKEQDWINSIAFGIAFGLGALTKYQIIFVIPILLTIIVIEKKILLIFRLLKTYLSFVISVIIVIPHLLWLKKNDWSSVERAVGPVIFENYWFTIEIYMVCLSEF